MKKLLTVLMAASLILCVGCAEKGTSTSDGAVSVSSAVDDGKFHFSDTVSNIKICGQDVTLPCTFKELGAGFEFDSPIEDKNNNYMFTSLKYNGTDIGTVYLELRDDGKYEESKILTLILNSKAEPVIKGASMESSEEDIIKALGEDFTKSDYNIDYGNEQDGLVRILMNDMTNTPISVTIIMPK